jgi:hypothetical protein
MRVILWTARSLRNLEVELNKLSHKVSPMTVGKLLRRTSRQAARPRKVDNILIEVPSFSTLMSRQGPS